MKIGIITGGSGSEREISLRSAANIQKLLKITDELVFDWPNDRERVLSNIGCVDVWVPMMHGEGGEDGEVQDFLNDRSVSYIFSDPDVHRIAIDKQKMKDFLGDEVKSPQTFYEYPGKSVIAKPVRGGSSIQIEKINSVDGFAALTSQYPDQDFLFEEFVSGREFTVGVVESENGEVVALPITEILCSGYIFDYDNKYDPKKLAKEVCPAEVPMSLEKELKDLAVRVHQTLGCKHISRSDFIVNEVGDIYFLEINTIPGFTKTSLVPQQIEAHGLDLREVFLNWVTAIA